MRLFVIGGFALGDKVELVQHVVSLIHHRDPATSITFILNEADETDFSSTEIDSDKIHFLTLKGGCPCCSLCGELEGLFATAALRDSEIVIMEVPGTCDTEQLSGAINKVALSVMVQCFQALEARTVRPLLEIVPVLTSNLRFCQGVVISGDEQDIDDAVQALRAMDEFKMASPRPIEAERSRFMLLARPSFGLEL